MSRYRTTMREALEKVYETSQGFALVQRAKELAKKFANNMTKAVAEIEKLEKGLSKNSSVRDALRKANEELAEGKMKDIFTADQEGESAAEIAKRLKLPLATVKKILGEEVEQLVEKIADKIIKDLQKAYAPMKGKTISPEMATRMSKHLDQPSYDLTVLRQLHKANIPFISTLARNKIYKKTGKFEAYLNEQDHEISMARGELEAISNKAQELSAALEGKSDATDGLEAWVQSKITKAKDYINSVSDYLLYNPDIKMEDKEIPPIDKDNAPGVKIAKIRAMDDKDGKEKDKSKDTIAALKDQIQMLKTKLENEKNKAVKPEPNPDTGEVPLTIGLAHKLLRDKEKKEVKEGFKTVGNEKGTEFKVYKNDKLVKTFPTYIQAHDYVKMNEADLTKSQIKKVHKMADELPKKDFKDRYGKEKGDAVRYATATNIVKKKLDIEESAAAREIDRTNTRRDSMDYQMYKKSAELLRKKDYKSLGKHIKDAETAPREYVMSVIDKKEPQAFKKMFGNQSGYYSLMKLKMSENKEADMMFKKLSQRAQTYVNELLRSGMGTMEAIQKAKDKFNEGVKEMSTNEEKRLYVEKIAALQKKADKSGMPYGILKKVYDRGMAAWKGGHRPGASQHQWAFARVNSFVTKSSGTWGGADKDLAAKVRGSK